MVVANWKDEKNYDLILDTAKLSLEECSEILLKRMNEKALERIIINDVDF